MGHVRKLSCMTSGFYEVHTLGTRTSPPGAQKGEVI